MKFQWLSAIGAAAIMATTLAQAGPVAGNSSGVFVDPILQPNSDLTGVGTNSFSWGTDATGGGRNNLTFNGQAFSGTVGSFFDVGTISYYNGSVFAGTGADGVSLDVTLSFTAPAGVVQTFTYALGIVSTTNTGDPIASADRIEFTTAAPQTFLLDGNLVTLVLEVGASGPGGFTSQNSFSVLENQSATAVLRGTLRAPSNVPEPGTMLLLAAAAAGAAFARHRKSV